MLAAAAGGSAGSARAVDDGPERPARGTRRIPQIHAELAVAQGRRTARGIVGEHIRLCGLAQAQCAAARPRTAPTRQLRAHRPRGGWAVQPSVTLTGQ